MKKVLLAFCVASLLFGCSAKDEHKGGSKITDGNTVTISKSEYDELVNNHKAGCDAVPKMTNDQIIAETKKCTDAGLGATAFHCGDDPTTMQIQCEPRNGNAS